MQLKKIISGVIAAAITVSVIPASVFAAKTVTTELYSDDFESYDVSVYPKPKPEGLTILGDSDSVYVDTVGSSKRLWLKNDGFVSDIQLRKSFSKVTGKTITFEMDFLQLYNTSDGDMILGVYSGDTAVAQILTKNGNIVYKTTSAETAIVANYVINKAYKIKMSVDLFNDDADIWVDGDLIGSYPLLSTVGTADGFRMVSKQLPGFAVDNLKVYLDESLDKVTVSGTTNAVIPKNGYTEYEYTAQVLDENGSTSNSAQLNWSLTGTPSGVSLLSTTGNSVKLKVEKTAAAGNFTITARVPDSDVLGTILVSTVPLTASSLKINGWEDRVEIRKKDGTKTYETYPSYRISSDGDEPRTFAFSASVLDQFGEETGNFESFTWSLFQPSGEAEIPSYVSINSRTGEVTVSKNPTTEQLIGIKAVSRDDNTIVGTTEISLLDFDTYAMDRERMNAVIGHVETVLDSATIETSPLISNTFVRGAGKPARILESSKDCMESNVMAESNLMRTMYNLSEVTGDPKYKERVDEIYKLIMTDARANDNSIAWGGHMTIDMETNRLYSTYNTGTHEIKGVSPFISPMFSENVNQEYATDTYNNGYGLAGYLFRCIVGGHAMGDYTNLDFERHWGINSYVGAFESVWQTPDVFDSDRKGPMQRTGGAAFTNALGNIIECLIEYYEATGDECGLEWAGNYAETQMNSSIYYFVYKDSNGNYIWPSDTTNMDYYADSTGAHGDEPKREFYDKNNKCVYISVKSDIRELSTNQYSANFVYQHRDLAEVDESGNVTDIVKVQNVETGEITELTLYNTWTDGSWAEPATTAGNHYKVKQVSDTLGYQWYENSNYKDYTGPEYGDRLYSNLVLGTDDPDDKDTWVELGYITEEEGSLMIDPYSRMRGNETTEEILLAICDTINKFAEAGKMDRSIELLEKASKGVYSSLKLRYDFNDDSFTSYMGWIRPNYMRSHEIVDYEEPAWDEEIADKNNKYLQTERSMGAAHRGYYYSKGDIFYSKRAEPKYISAMATICESLRTSIEYLEATDRSDPKYAENMEKAEIFRNRTKFIWKVLRDICMGKATMGDIGEDFFNLEPNLKMDTSANNIKAVEMAVNLYRATGHKDFLKYGRAVANNVMRATYIADEQVFSDGGGISDYFMPSSVSALPVLLELDAYLLDRFDDNIKYTILLRGSEFYDTYMTGKDGSYRQNNGHLVATTTLYPNDTVKVTKVRINHESIELKVGESVTIDYDVIPYDADSQDVIWDVYDQRVAMMDTDTNKLYGLKKGKTKVRCVSKSALGVASEEVEVIVK